MQDEIEETEETQSELEKSTITIAEKQGSSATADAQPTITIAEKDGGK